jgi:hypothetical protein
MWPPLLDQGCYAEVTTELGLESDVWRAAIGWGTCVCEVFVFLSAIRKGLREVKETWKDGVVEHFSVSGAAFLENTLSLIYCVCISYSGLHTALRQAAVGVLLYISAVGITSLALCSFPINRAVMSLASVVGWLYMLWFLLGLRLTGVGW